jgi:hypothetical protein
VHQREDGGVDRIFSSTPGFTTFSSTTTLLPLIFAEMFISPASYWYLLPTLGTPYRRCFSSPDIQTRIISRPLELTSAQWKQLDDILDSGPVSYGLHTGIWTSPMIAWVIDEEFGIH